MRRLGLLICVWSAIAMISGRANASDRVDPGGNTGPVAVGTPSPVGGEVIVGDPVQAPGDSGGGGGGGGDSGDDGDVNLNVTCGFFTMDAEPVDGNQADPSTFTNGEQVYELCVDTFAGDTVFSGPIIWQGAAAPQVDPATLAQYAKAKLTLPAPAPRSWPDLDIPQITGIPTWLHVDNFVADQKTATAGNVSATVHADPVRVDWDMGDGGHVTCNDAGATFTYGASTDCGYVFTTRSTATGDGRFHGTVTITWHLWWDSNIGRRGDLGAIARATPTDWTVHELQALIN
jgi:hypothetical protein